MLGDKFVLTFNNKHYRLNIRKINEFCLVSSGKNNNEAEITEAYESDESGEFRLTSKINREVTTAGNSQNDMIVYDFVKSLVVKLLESNTDTRDGETDIDFGFALAFNTLLSEGMLEEITNENI